MPPSDSITLWLQKLKAGCADEAAARIWAVYFEKLARQAQGWLHSRRTAADGEDAALEAFDSFVRAVGRGQFPKLDDRDDLWRVLFQLTRCKAMDLLERELAAKRGGGTVVQVSALWPADEEPAAEALSREPDPGEAAILAEQTTKFFDRLGDPGLRQVAAWKLEGHTNAEIASKIGRVESTVERKLKLIRDICRDAGWPAGD